MFTHQDSDSPSPESIMDHYASGSEAKRLESGPGQLERERTRELLQRFLPPRPALVLDVGGGPGIHACWLARLGYDVHLIDLVPLHVAQAREASAQQPETPLASATVGDARTLPWNNNSANAVLLFGPLYHLTERQDRDQSLAEAYRVLKPGGVLLAVGISRFASVLAGQQAGYLKDPRFVEIVEGDLKTGQHQNRTDNPEYFMDTFFHHPEELRTEVSDAGFSVRGIYGVETSFWLAPDLDDWWSLEERRQLLLRLARSLETEPSLLGISAHLMAVGVKE